ncbi:hypothetical protein [Caviibacter abscessus]|uniref:hypothetical protein n=1 Tax=Caviibacter abscessus TaxID=1766719 RepID=UPI0008332AAD|nr:hypothetical protein [Caviibacter abscessus]
MKKTILFISLLTTLASVASTTGNIEVQGSIKKELTNSSSNTDFESKIKGELAIKGSGLKLGTELKIENTSVKNSDSKVWAEYKFHEIGGITPTLKGTAKFDGKFDLEAKFNAAIGKTDFEFNTKYESEKLITGKGVSANLNAKFNQVKNTKFETLIGTWRNLENGKNEAKYYGEFGVEYKGFENILLKFSEKLTLNEKTEASLQLKASVKYEGVKNVILEAKVDSELNSINKPNALGYNIITEGYAEYKYKPIEPITLSPKLHLKAVAKSNGSNGSGPKHSWGELTITPSVKLQCKTIKELTFTATSELPIKFNFEKYTTTVTGKFSAGIKYEW